MYIAFNQKHPVLSKPKVVEALKLLVDYEGMANSFLKGQFDVHQSFWPAGLWASADDSASGFSHNTCRPRSRALMTMG